MFELGPDEIYRATTGRQKFSLRRVHWDFVFLALVFVIVLLGSVGTGILLLLIGALVFGFYVTVRGIIALFS